MIDLAAVRSLAAAALESISRQRTRINALNVYPVPDGDTGTNLEKTMEGIVDALERSEASTTAALAAEVQRAATMEAKGNSGVILSTIVRGMARVLGESERIDGEVLAAALRAGATSAYQAVKVPVEGTMLTVIREMAEEAELPDVRHLPPVEGSPASWRGVRTRSSGPRACSTSCVRPASSTPVGRGSSSSCAACSTG